MKYAELKPAIDAVKEIKENNEFLLSTDCDNLHTVLAAATAHLATLPKTKIIQCWKLSYFHRSWGAVNAPWHPHVKFYTNYADAERQLKKRQNDLVHYHQVTLVGPELFEIPA